MLSRLASIGVNSLAEKGLVSLWVLLYCGARGAVCFFCSRRAGDGVGIRNSFETGGQGTSPWPVSPQLAVGDTHCPELEFVFNAYRRIDSIESLGWFVPEGTPGPPIVDSESTERALKGAIRTFDWN